MTKYEESEARRLYKQGLSTCQIAALFNTNTNKIRRLLLRNGDKLRGMSEAQSLSLRNGIRSNPTLGKERPKGIKDRISETKRKKYWQKLTEEQKNVIYQEAMKYSNGVFPVFLWNCLMRLGYGILLEHDQSRILVFTRKCFIYFNMQYDKELNYSNMVVIPKAQTIESYSKCFLCVAAILETKLNNSFFLIEE